MLMPGSFDVEVTSRAYADWDPGRQPLRTPQEHDLQLVPDRLLRHRLLRQPHGFEGVGPVAVLADFDDLAVAEAGDVRLADLDGHVTVAASTPKTQACDDAIAYGENLLDLRLEVRHVRPTLGDQGAIAVVAPVGLGDRFIRRRPPLDVPVERGDDRFDLP